MMESWLDIILKYNPYHDEKGRFAESGGAHSVRQKDGTGFSTLNAMEAHGQDVSHAYLTPHDTKEIVMARAVQQANGSRVTSTDTINSEERDKIRQEAVDKVYNNAVAKVEEKGIGLKQDRQAWVVIGPPASGKSAISDPIGLKNGALEIDADEAKKALPEYNGGRGAGIVHEESSMIAEAVRAQAMHNGDNMVLPIVGKSMGSIEKLASQLEANGYKAHLVLMDVNKDNATSRAIARWQNTGRFVDTAYVYNGVGNKPQENYESIKNNAVASAKWASISRYDNNGPRNVGAVHIEGVNHLKG